MMSMHLRITLLTAGLALWNIVFTISLPGIPLARETDFELEEQALVYDGGAGQILIMEPSLVAFTVPLPPSTPSPETSIKPVSSPGSPITPPSATPSPLSIDTYPKNFKLPEWVIAPYPLSLKDEDRVNVFETMIEGITLASKHSPLGNNNAGIYSIASFTPSFAQEYFPRNIASLNPDPSRLLVKVLKDVDDDVIAEVKALKIVGQFVASGRMRVQMEDDESMYEIKPMIVMLKMPGQALTSTPGFIAAKDMETKRQMMSDSLMMMCDKVGEMALEYGFVHRDNIIPNVMVIADGTTIIDVNIIDWGGKYLSSIRDDVTWDDLMAWCHRRWAVPVWERGYIYGYIPLPVPVPG